MSTAITPETREQEWRGRFRHDNYLNADYGIKSWLLTKDHKRIALLYLITVTFFFFLGGAYAVAIRMELMTPLGDLMQSHTYNKVKHDVWRALDKLPMGANFTREMASKLEHSIKGQCSCSCR